ncbi:hypothetical protein BRARA_H02188 [Brassica rapa]|uniref:Bet v I/Major latex protein domain-containing protein n=1 Tax=Brassica campestris TaxID=3711 RepID=A0A397YDJ9_BRACM|nr:hypothetical protein BRARA_H02188 [Brassica rapa]
MLHGSYYGVLDIESPADEFIQYFTRKREWKCYNHDSFSFSAAVVEIEAEDWDNRTTTISVRSSNLLLTKYKKLKVTTTITPKEDYNKGSHVKWTIDAEKISGHIQDPDLFIDTAFSIFEDIRNSYLVRKLN